MSYDHIQERFSEFSFLRGFINPVESFCVTLSIIYLHKNRGTEKPLVYTANNYLTQRYIEREDLEDIFNFLDTVDTETLKGYIKNEICVRHSQTILFQTNTQQISDIALKLLNVSNNESILDFGSSLGAFLIYANDYLKLEGTVKNTFTGLEIDLDDVNILKMAFDLLDIHGNVYQGDYLNKEMPDYDKGFVFPPVGLRTESSLYSVNYPDIQISNNSSSSGLIFVDRMLHKMKKDGRVVALLPLAVLFNSSCEKYRNKLIEEGVLEGIIELPNGTINSIGTKMAFIIFSGNNESVKIVDATAMSKGEKTRRFDVELSIDEIMEAYYSEKCLKIESTELQKYSNISPSSLLSRPAEVKDGHILSEVAEVFSGAQYTISKFKDYLSPSKTDRRIITSSDINNGIVEWNQLPFISEIKKFDKYAVKKGDLIVTSKSSKVKIAVVDIEPEELIIVTGGMLIIRPNECLDGTFLKIFLESSEGQRALKAIQKGSYITTMNSKDLKEIVVPVPDLDYQQRIASKYNNQLTTLYALREEARVIEEKLNVFYETEVLN